MLFHYTSRAAALEGILPSGQLRLGRLPRTNDPREFLPIAFSIAGFVADDQNDLTEEDPIELSERADALLRDSVHLLCLTEDRHPGPPHGVGSFGNGPLRARMWAQYADNHAGVCFGFDRERLLDGALGQLKRHGTRVLHGAVVYSSEHRHVPTSTTLIQPDAEKDLRAYIDAIVEQHARPLFFTKDWDWASETEYRILLRGETDEEEYIGIRDALELVIVGPRFPMVYAPLVRLLCDELAALPLRLFWRNGLPLITHLRDRRPG